MKSERSQGKSSLGRLIETIAVVGLFNPKLLKPSTPTIDIKALEDLQLLHPRFLDRDRSIPSKVPVSDQGIPV